MHDDNNVEIRVTSPARGCHHRPDDIVIVSREPKAPDLVREFLARLLAMDIENAGLIAV